MVTELLQKYIWLVQTFIRAGQNGLTLSEIESRWEDRFDSPYSRRTFNNHREAVEEVFGITIECNRSTNCYFINYSDEVADENAAMAWLINTFTVNNILSLGKDRLSGRVSVEDIPSGHTHLTRIMEAMTEGNELIVGYKKYSSSTSDSLHLRPYAVKEFAKRWYLIAYCVERQGLRVYGLDRITELETSYKKFKMPKNFDVQPVIRTSKYLTARFPCHIAMCAPTMAVFSRGSLFPERLQEQSAKMITLDILPATRFLVYLPGSTHSPSVHSLPIPMRRFI